MEGGEQTARPVAQVKVGALVINQNGRRRAFLRRRWVCLFPEGLEQVSRGGRAVLLQAIATSLVRDGLLVTLRRSLGDYSRPQIVAILSELEEQQLIKRVGDLIFLSPLVCYQGRVENYEAAVEEWERITNVESLGG